MSDVLTEDKRPTTEGLELLALHCITRLIGTAANLETTLTSILQVLHDTMRMERATLLLMDEETQRLTIHASCGLSVAEEMRGVYKPDGGGLRPDLPEPFPLRRSRYPQ